ncbi:MAG: hypothetical protein ACFFDF_02545 [Candidatus Odinarchaeota archaeon]
MSQNFLMQKFQKVFGQSFAKEILFEFQESKTAYWLGDVTKGLLHAARFSEICIACIKQLSDPSKKINLNKIIFEKFYEDLRKLSKPSTKEEMLYLVIPQILKGIYTIRNKKRVAHIKMNNADSIDFEFVITSCNWVMSQLIIIYLNISLEDVINLTNSIMERKTPIIEQFENGGIMILKRGLKFKEELLLVLYQFPKRMTRQELNLILKPKNPSYISTYLNGLFKEKLIHLNKEGAIINKNGIKEIEINKEKYFI